MGGYSRHERVLERIQYSVWLVASHWNWILTEVNLIDFDNEQYHTTKTICWKYLDWHTFQHILVKYYRGKWPLIFINIGLPKYRHYDIAYRYIVPNNSQTLCWRPKKASVFQALKLKIYLKYAFNLKGALDKYNIIPNFFQKKLRVYTIRSVGINDCMLSFTF